MIHWSPANDALETYMSEWNPALSETEKLQTTNLFFFFKNKKGFNERQAKSLAEMVVYKQKYRGIKYSAEQEAVLKQALIPVFNTSI
jgi:predicted adenine nucleotide alpha hydrolase (AANH) superfamily ATPase